MSGRAVEKLRSCVAGGQGDATRRDRRRLSDGGVASRRRRRVVGVDVDVVVAAAAAGAPQPQRRDERANAGNERKGRAKLENVSGRRGAARRGEGAARLAEKRRVGTRISERMRRRRATAASASIASSACRVVAFSAAVLHPAVATRAARPFVRVRPSFRPSCAALGRLRRLFTAASRTRAPPPSTPCSTQ